MALAQQIGKIREYVKTRVIGQDDQIEKVLPYIEVYNAGMAAVDRPAGVFMLLGLTGSGKTYFVEMLAEALHDARNLLAINCAEFALDHEIAKLIGAPPGYLGHGETKAKLEQFSINACSSQNSRLSIILFDEVEKASPRLFELLLGVLDKGVLDLGNNRRTYFKDTLIFMTGNVGARKINAMDARFALGQYSDIPVTSHGKEFRNREDIVNREIAKLMSPEFINRIDESIVFNSLTKEDAVRIAMLELEKSLRQNRNNYFRINKNAAEWVAGSAYDSKKGAREVKRFIYRNVVVPVARKINEAGADTANTLWDVSFDGELRIVKEEKRTAKA